MLNHFFKDHPASRIQYPASRIQYPASPTSISIPIQNPKSKIQNSQPVGAASGVFEHDDGGVGGGLVGEAQAEGAAGTFADLEQFDVFDVDFGGEERAGDVG